MAEGRNAGILDIDLGNSAMKYRFGEFSKTQAHRGDGSIDVASISLGANAVSVGRIRLGSVLGEVQSSVFAADAYDRWGVSVEFARSVRTAGGVTNGYRDAAALGVDRWLAVLAAYRRSTSAALVIDLGTAITLDYVDDEGVHNGGYIVPGTHLMQSALLNDTASVEFSGAHSEAELQPGCSTQEAVSRGVVLMVVNLIEVEVDRFRKLCHHAPATILCGGGAQVIAPYLQCPYEIVPELVLDGLSVALP